MTVIKINGKEIPITDDLKPGNLYKLDGVEFVAERVILDLDNGYYICETRLMEK